MIALTAAILLSSSFSAIDPNETKAMLEYYHQHTGKPAYALLEENWGKDTSGIWIIPEYRQGFGDLNCDGVVDANDLWLYDGLTGEAVGWTVNGDAGHPDDKCYQLARSTKTKTIQSCKRICLTCAARRMTND